MMMVAGDFVRYQSESSVGERCRAQMRAESNSSDFRVCVSIKSLEMLHRKSLPNVDEGSLISCQRLASLDFSRPSRPCWKVMTRVQSAQ